MTKPAWNSYITHEDIANRIHVQNDLFEPELVDLVNYDKQVLFIGCCGHFFLQSQKLFQLQVRNFHL